MKAFFYKYQQFQNRKVRPLFCDEIFHLASRGFII